MTVIAFPREPVRAWRVFPARSPHVGYQGRRCGEGPYIGPDRTEVGALDIVVAALVKAEVRCGLPVVAPAECLPALMDKPSPLRIFPWKRSVKTDRQKYSDALREQRGRDDHRWVPCENRWPEEPA